MVKKLAFVIFDTQLLKFSAYLLCSLSSPQKIRRALAVLPTMLPSLNTSVLTSAGKSSSSACEIVKSVMIVPGLPFAS